jgi:hypothetical protein
MMRKQSLRILIALIGVVGSGGAARAQDLDKVVAKIPYEFVVDGETFPAGSYQVDRVSSSDDRKLVLRNLDNHASVLVVPVFVESNSADQVRISFERVGEELFLSKIETVGHVFTIPVSRSAIIETAAKSHSSTSDSASAAGSN